MKTKEQLVTLGLNEMKADEIMLLESKMILDEVVVAEDIALIPVGWYVENACFDVEHIVNKIYGTIETSGAVLR